MKAFKFWAMQRMSSLEMVKVCHMVVLYPNSYCYIFFLQVSAIDSITMDKPGFWNYVSPFEGGEGKTQMERQRREKEKFRNNFSIQVPVSAWLRGWTAARWKILNEDHLILAWCNNFGRKSYWPCPEFPPSHVPPA